MSPRIHRIIAFLTGFLPDFGWMECPACEQAFGGHQVAFLRDHEVLDLGEAGRFPVCPNPACQEGARDARLDEYKPVKLDGLTEPEALLALVGFARPKGKQPVAKFREIFENDQHLLDWLEIMSGVLEKYRKKGRGFAGLRDTTYIEHVGTNKLEVLFAAGRVFPRQYDHFYGQGRAADALAWMRQKKAVLERNRKAREEEAKEQAPPADA